MRNIKDVADQINEVAKNEELKQELDRIVKDSKFTAPEGMYIRWGEMHDILIDIVGRPISSEVALQVWEIFTESPKDVFIKGELDIILDTLKIIENQASNIRTRAEHGIHGTDLAAHIYAAEKAINSVFELYKSISGEPSQEFIETLMSEPSALSLVGLEK